MISFKTFLMQVLTEAFNLNQAWTQHGPKILERLKQERSDSFRGQPESRHHEIGKQLLSDFVNSADPSPNKSYGNWIARTYAGGKESGIGHIEDTGQVNDMLSAFRNKTVHVKRLGLSTDIDTYGSLHDLRNTVQQLPLSRIEQKERAKGKGDIPDIRDSIKQITDEKNTYLFPKNKEETIAAAYHPDGSDRSEWCVSHPVEKYNKYDHYNDDKNPESKFMIVRPHKGKPGEQYAWHPLSGEFQNLENEYDGEAFHRIMSSSRIMQEHLKNIFLGKTK